MRAISSTITISASGPRNDSGSSPEKNTHIAPFGHSSRRRDDTQRGRGSRPQVAKMPLLPSMLTSWKSDVVGAMKWMRDIPARTAVCTAADIECDLPAPRPPRNNQHHDRSDGGSCASRAAKTQSSAASSPSPRISSWASSGVISLMSWRNWCMRLTSRKKRSAIVVVLFYDFAIDDAIFLASYIIDERADFLGRQQHVAASDGAVQGRLARGASSRGKISRSTIVFAEGAIERMQEI